MKSTANTAVTTGLSACTCKVEFRAKGIGQLPSFVCQANTQKIVQEHESDYEISEVSIEDIISCNGEAFAIVVSRLISLKSSTYGFSICAACQSKEREKLRLKKIPKRTVSSSSFPPPSSSSQSSDDRNFTGFLKHLLAGGFYAISSLTLTKTEAGKNENDSNKRKTMVAVGLLVPTAFSHCMLYFNGDDLQSFRSIVLSTPSVKVLKINKETDYDSTRLGLPISSSSSLGGRGVEAEEALLPSSVKNEGGGKKIKKIQENLLDKVKKNANIHHKDLEILFNESTSLPDNELLSMKRCQSTETVMTNVSDEAMPFLEQLRATNEDPSSKRLYQTSSFDNENTLEDSNLFGYLQNSSSKKKTINNNYREDTQSFRPNEESFQFSQNYGDQSCMNFYTSATGFEDTYQQEEKSYAGFYPSTSKFIAEESVSIIHYPNLAEDSFISNHRKIVKMDEEVPLAVAPVSASEGKSRPFSLFGVVSNVFSLLRSFSPDKGPQPTSLSNIGKSYSSATNNNIKTNDVAAVKLEDDDHHDSEETTHEDDVSRLLMKSNSESSSRETITASNNLMEKEEEEEAEDNDDQRTVSTLQDELIMPIKEAEPPTTFNNNNNNNHNNNNNQLKVNEFNQRITSTITKFKDLQPSFLELFCSFACVGRQGDVFSFISKSGFAPSGSETEKDDKLFKKVNKCLRGILKTRLGSDPFVIDVLAAVAVVQIFLNLEWCDKAKASTKLKKLSMNDLSENIETALQKLSLAMGSPYFTANCLNNFLPPNETGPSNLFAVISLIRDRFGSLECYSSLKGLIDEYDEKKRLETLSPEKSLGSQSTIDNENHSMNLNNIDKTATNNNNNNSHNNVNIMINPAQKPILPALARTISTTSLLTKKQPIFGHRMNMGMKRAVTMVANPVPARPLIQHNFKAEDENKKKGGRKRSFDDTVSNQKHIFSSPKPNKKKKQEEGDRPSFGDDSFLSPQLKVDKSRSLVSRSAEVVEGTPIQSFVRNAQLPGVRQSGESMKLFD